MLSCFRRARPPVCTAVPCVVTDYDGKRFVSIDDSEKAGILRHHTAFGMVRRFLKIGTDCQLTLKKLDVVRVNGSLAKVEWGGAFSSEIAVWPVKKTSSVSVSGSKDTPSSLLKAITAGFNATFKAHKDVKDDILLNDTDDESERGSIDLAALPKAKKMKVSVPIAKNLVLHVSVSSTSSLCCRSSMRMVLGKLIFIDVHNTHMSNGVSC